MFEWFGYIWNARIRAEEDSKLLKEILRMNATQHEQMQALLAEAKANADREVEIRASLLAYINLLVAKAQPAVDGSATQDDLDALRLALDATKAATAEIASLVPPPAPVPAA